MATLLKNVKMTMIHSLWCNVDASWQRRPHGMPLLKTNTTEQISLSYTAKYCQGANIIIIHCQILSRCKYHYHTPPNIVKGANIIIVHCQILSRCKYQTPPNIIIVKRQISFTHINIIIFFTNDLFRTNQLLQDHSSHPSP